MVNSPKKANSPKKQKIKKVLPIKRYKSITRKKGGSDSGDKPEVHTNQGVSRVPWEPSSSSGSIAEASPIAARQFNLDFKGWSKSKKDTIGQVKNGNTNGQSKLSKEITVESDSVKVNGNNSKSVKKRSNYSKSNDSNSTNTQEIDNQSNSLLALDEWLTSDQMNIEVSEPSKSTTTKPRVKSKIKFIPNDEEDFIENLQSPKKQLKLKSSTLSTPSPKKNSNNGRVFKKLNSNIEKEVNIEDYTIEDSYADEEEEEEVLEKSKNSRRESVLPKRSVSPPPQSMQAAKKSRDKKIQSFEPSKPVKRIPIPLKDLSELSTELLKEKKRTLELEQQLLYLKQEKKSLKPLPPLSEDITNDYSEELKASQDQLKNINNEINALREEKASNLLTLIHNLRSKTDKKTSSITNLTNSNLNQSYLLFYKLITNINIKKLSLNQLDLIRLNNRYENIKIWEKFECNQIGPQGVHNYYLYTVQDNDEQSSQLIYEPIDPYESNHIPWQYLPEYLRDKLLFDLSQGPNFLRMIFKILNNGGGNGRK